MTKLAEYACVGWAQYNVCSHTLAVAEILGILAKFLQWFRNSNKSGSTTRMANVGTPKRPKRRKGKANALPEVRTAFPCASRLTNHPSSVSDVVPSTSTCIPTTSSVNSNLGMSTVSTTCPKPQRTVTAETPLPPIGYFDSTSQQISTSACLLQPSWKRSIHVTSAYAPAAASCFVNSASFL